jgi:hypothetical protein
MSSSQTTGEARPNDRQIGYLPRQNGRFRRSSAILRSGGAHRDGSALSKTPNSRTLASKPEPIRGIQRMSTLTQCEQNEARHMSERRISPPRILSIAGAPLAFPPLATVRSPAASPVRTPPRLYVLRLASPTNLRLARDRSSRPASADLARPEDMRPDWSRRRAHRAEWGRRKKRAPRPKRPRSRWSLLESDDKLPGEKELRAGLRYGARCFSILFA